MRRNERTGRIVVGVGKVFAVLGLVLAAAAVALLIVAVVFIRRG